MLRRGKVPARGPAAQCGGSLPLAVSIARCVRPVAYHSGLRGRAMEKTSPDPEGFESPHEALCSLFRWYLDSPLPLEAKDEMLRAGMAAILGLDLALPEDRARFQRVLSIMGDAAGLVSGEPPHRSDDDTA